MNVEFLTSAEKQALEQQLEKQYGIKKLPFLLFKVGKNKIRAYSGNLSRQELSSLGRMINIQLIGIKLCEIEQDGIVLNYDAISLFNKQINKKIIEINKQESIKFMHGQDLQIDTNLNGFYIIKHNSELIGIGKASQGMLKNLIPRERRIK